MIDKLGFDYWQVLCDTCSASFDVEGDFSGAIHTISWKWLNVTFNYFQ
jgi:hypothetical protein